MVKKRAIKAGLSPTLCNHTFRVTSNGTLEKAQAITAHFSTKTTKLYDRRDDQLSLDEIERILIWSCKLIYSFRSNAALSITYILVSFPSSH